MQLHNAQWGFRKGRNTRDAVLVARILCELVAEWEQQLKLRRRACIENGSNAETLEAIEKETLDLEAIRIMLYLADIKKAYPNTARTFLWRKMKKGQEFQMV